MTTEDQLRKLLVAASEDVPARHLSVPLAAVRNRARRRRQIKGTAVAAIVVVALVGGLFVGQQIIGRAARQDPTVTPSVSPSGDGSATVPWKTAMVSRDDTTITVYAGASDLGCKDLRQPRATITKQDDTRVVIAVHARAVPAGECGTSQMETPLAVTLQEPLGDRALRDAAGGVPHPAYFERELPDLRSDTRWRGSTGQWSGLEDRV